MSDEEPPKSEKRGIPAWVMTFADLMTLLMCFFVLLLSFSEMDVAKFKQLSGSMKDAFGVQADVEVRTIPKGTSVVAREFSPAKPEPTPINTVRQHTIDSNKNSLDALNRENRDTEDQVRRLRKALQSEIENGAIELKTEGTKVIIHILEKASFDSGEADIKPQFLPVLRKIATLLNETDGSIMVSGHTDDVPISNERFRSNWDLSTSRAVSVAHELLGATSLGDDRFVVTGHAATRPVADNTTAENRAKNRRVDISIIRGNGQDEVQKLSADDGLMTSQVIEDGAR